jgi:hypothetical protein
MSKKRIEESVKLAAQTFNAIGILFLGAGIAGPFLPGGADLPLTELGVRVILGLGFHGVAQGILWFGWPKSKDDSTDDDDTGNGGSGAIGSSRDFGDPVDLSEDGRPIPKAPGGQKL